MGKNIRLSVSLGMCRHEYNMIFQLLTLVFVCVCQSDKAPESHDGISVKPGVKVFLCIADKLVGSGK